MAITVSRRSVLKTTIGAAVGGAGIVSTAAQAQAQPAGGPTDRFFRDDWFGEPWRKPQAVVLIHGALESGVVWFAWVPTLAKEYRVLRPDLPGCGLSTVPAGFEWSFRGSCGLHRERARQGGRRVRSYRRRENGRPDRDAVRRRFSSKDAVSVRRQRTGFGHLDYESIARSAERQTRVVRIRGDDRVLERDGEDRAASGHARAECGAIELRPRKRWRSAAHRGTLADHHGGQKRAAVRREGCASIRWRYRDSRLVVLQSDAYHIAVANPDECVANVLAFIREHA